MNRGTSVQAPVCEYVARPAAHAWRHYAVGNASVQPAASALRLTVAGASSAAYADAQLDDVRPTADIPLVWSPPLRLTLRARFSHPAGGLRGTAGFGFWNHPLLPQRGRLPRLPQAIWFFYASPPSDLRLDRHTPGDGWKAATVDTGRAAALGWLPLAPLAVGLMNVPALYPPLWDAIQPAVGVREAALAHTMTDWHIYTLEWGHRTSRLLIDGQPVLCDAPSPRGPLCFVAWIDNQYAIVTPWGRLGWGLLDVPAAQWLEIDWLAIEPG